MVERDARSDGALINSSATPIRVDAGATIRATLRYDPAPIRAKITLFLCETRTRDGKVEEGWRELSLLGMDCHHIPRTSHGQIFSKQHVGKVVAIVLSRLRGGRHGHSQSVSVVE